MEPSVVTTDVFTAGDLGKVLSGFEVLNPELVICRLDTAASFQMDFTINKGRGWVPADENRELLSGADLNEIAIDSIYTPEHLETGKNLTQIACSEHIRARYAYRTFLGLVVFCELLETNLLEV